VFFCTAGDRLSYSEMESNSMSCTWGARAAYLSPNQTRPYCLHRTGNRWTVVTHGMLALPASLFGTAKLLRVSVSAYVQ
jgi:hypothetical protein